MTRQGVVKLIVAAILSLPAGLALGGGVAQAQPVTGFTQDFRLEDCTFSAKGRNAFFSIEPGDQLVLEGEEDGAELVVTITALNQVKTIKLRTSDGGELRIKTRVVEERELEDDELVEVSRNFFARCEETNDIYYFGEDVDNYEDGVIVDHDGSWRAGKAGARPGLIMPGTFLLGSRYFQEIAPEVALDRGENVAMGLAVDVPAGSFEDCVEVRETSPLDRPGSESRKVYCPGVGLVFDDGVELVDFDVEDDEEE